MTDRQLRSYWSVKLDIAFAEIAVGLNADQFERYRAGIGKAMDAADREHAVQAVAACCAFGLR